MIDINISRGRYESNPWRNCGSECVIFERRDATRFRSRSHYTEFHVRLVRDIYIIRWFM